MHSGARRADGRAPEAMFDLLDPTGGVRLAADTRRRAARSDDLWIQPLYA